MDNTNTNTGCEAGMVTALEKKLKRKVHTIGCSLHQNELQLEPSLKQLMELQEALLLSLVF